MAATRLIALHINKGKTVAQCLRERTDYAQNPEKTAKGDLVTGYQCDPMTVDEEFLLSKRQYQHITGKHQKHEVIAYQIRQSFKPGEITPEEANQVGYELAERFTKGKHAFIVATHTDRAHICLPHIQEGNLQFAVAVNCLRWAWNTDNRKCQAQGYQNQLSQPCFVSFLFHRVPLLNASLDFPDATNYI